MDILKTEENVYLGVSFLKIIQVTTHILHYHHMLHIVMTNNDFCCVKFRQTNRDYFKTIIIIMQVFYNASYINYTQEEGKG